MSLDAKCIKQDIKCILPQMVIVTSTEQVSNFECNLQFLEVSLRLLTRLKLKNNVIFMEKEV